MEAGERLGFLPGTLQEKVDPYLRPLYDALYDMLDNERVEKLLERNVIEVAPIAFMRGRTLNDSFIILDEAQNSTSEQMKMVLTRQGFNSKMVVNGDITQIDLPTGRRSGLMDAVEVLKGVEGISFVQFDEKDVVRHTPGAAHRQSLRAVQRDHRRGPAAHSETRANRNAVAIPVAGGLGNRSAGLSRRHVLSRRQYGHISPRSRRVCAAAPSSDFARRLQAEVARKAVPSTCLITGDAELRRLNREFRGQDYATDVLSFPARRLPAARSATSPSPWPAPAPRRASSATPPNRKSRS